MSDEEYTKKLQSMQQYIPFLEVMIKQLKDPKKKNREQQLQKMESLYAMITDTKRKLKYETLVKCEDVIKKIQEKVNPPSVLKLSTNRPEVSGMQKFICKDPPEKPFLNIDKMRDEKFRLELARSKLQELTPASPSPPRDIPMGTPIIPTERVERRERPNIYTAAGATLLAKDTQRKCTMKATSSLPPATSKPLLTKEDLKLLEMSDVTETDVSEKTLDELESIRQKLYRELDETKDNPLVAAKTKETTEPANKTPTKKPPRVEKIVKEPDSIFGSILSSLDGKIMETTKKDSKRPAKKDHKSDVKDKGDPKHKNREPTEASKPTVEETQKSSKPDSGGVPNLKNEPSDGAINKPVDSSSGGGGGVFYKRLADKYNPKPRKHSIEEDVEKQIEEQIQSAKPPVIEVLPQLSSPTNTCAKRFQQEAEPVESSRPNWFEPPSRIQEQQELIKIQHNSPMHNSPMHNSPMYKNPIPVINQLCNQTPQVRINTNLNPVGNLTPMDPFLSSPTGFMSPTSIFQSQMLPIQPNQLVQQQNQQMLPQNRQPIMNQGFAPPQNQFVARNQMMAHSTNIGGNTFVNNFIMQQPPSGFFQQKKSFNPYEPISGEGSQSDTFEPPQNDFQRFQGNARGNYNQPRGNFTRPRMQNRFGDGEDRPHHLDRDPRRQPRDNRDPRLAPTRRSIECRDETKFDVTYSKLDQKDTFVSPLDSLYNNTGGEVHGKGYGVQKFKIPKIKKPEKDPVKELKAKVVPVKVEAATSSERVEETPDSSREEVKELTTESVSGGDESQGTLTKVDESPNDTKVEVKEKQEEVKEVKEEKKLATEEDLIKELVKGIIDRAPDQKEVLYSIINTLTGKKKKKKFKKIRPVIESDSDSSSSSDDGESGDSSDKDSEVKETKPKSKKVTKSSPPNKDEEVPKKTKPKVSGGKSEEKSTKSDGERESTPPSSRLRSRRASLKKSEETEPPQESVGERTKNRKRQVVPQATPKTIQRRHKTELDLLHEDIKEMFIRDGVLTATGKRMCRILKDNPEALNATKKSPQTNERRTSFEEDDDVPLVSRLRKPQTKGDTTDGTESPKTLAAKTNLCVLLEKSINIEELSKKTLELEDRAKKSSDTSTETDEKSSEIADTTTETDTTFDSDATKNRSPKITKKKKPKSSWYTGTIKKKKKKVRALSETPSSANSPIPHDDTSSVTSEQEVTSEPVVETTKTQKNPEMNHHHHKDYYWKPDDKMDCKLCQFKGKLIVLHYKTVHNQSEVLVSRLKPEVCEEALKNTDQPFDLDPHENPRHRYTYECAFCGATFKNSTAESFHDHLASHTGEYRYHCYFCRFQSSSCKSLRTHLNQAHTTTITNKNNILEPTHSIPHGRRYVYGHMCGDCHYVQMSLASVEEHIRNYHKENSDSVKIVKINLSRTLPELPVSTTKKKDTEGDGGETSTLKDTEGVDDGPTNDDTEVVQDKQPVVRKKPGPKPKKKVIVLKKPPPKKKVEEKTTTVSDGDNSEVVTPSDGELPSKSPNVGDDVPQNDDELMEEEEKITSTVTSEIHQNSDGVVEETPTASGDTDKSPPSLSGADDIVDNNTKVANEKSLTDSVGVENIPTTTTTTKKDGATEPTKDSSVFTTDTDLNEDNQQIENERREKMQAVYDSLKRHHSSFIEKLKTKLDNQKNAPQSPPTINSEQESEITSTVTELCKKAAIRVADLDETPSSSGGLENPPQDPTQGHKKQVPIIGTIERLQEQLTAAPKLSPFAESNSLMPPPLTPVKDFDLDTAVDLIQSGPVVIRKLNHTTEYLCFVPGCTFVSYTELAFDGHLRQEHGDYGDHGGKCAICTKTIGDGGISELFAHIIGEHLNENLRDAEEGTPDDFGDDSNQTSENGGFDQNPELDGGFDDGHSHEDKVVVEDTKKVAMVPLLRTRRMSGDILSSDTKKCIKQEILDDSDGDGKIQALKTEGDGGDNEGLIIPSEESFFPFAIKSVETEDEFTMPIISNVVSLAEDTNDGYKNEPQLPPPPPLRPLPNSQFIRLDSLTKSGTQINLMITPDSTNKSNLLILNQLPQSSASPPQVRNIQQSPPGPTKRVLLKEFPMTADDFKMPKKSQEAMIAMCMHSNLINLYKCPVFDCVFTTNGRMAFENHLTTKHEDQRKQLLPCVYCNFKTEYSHIVIHHDVRHGGCLYACCYCVYRAVCQGYVEVHQNEMHQRTHKRVLLLPVHKDSMSSKGRVVKPRLKDLISPYKCGQRGCSRVFLATTDFVRHLKTHVVIEYSCSVCSYKTSIVDCLLKHQSEMHGMFYYNCAYCKMGASHINLVFRHQALQHFGNSPDIVLRAFRKRKVSMGTVLLEQDYDDLCHNRTDFKQTSSLVPISKILPKVQPATTTSGAASVLKEKPTDGISPELSLSIDDLIRETLSDEPLLELPQKDPNSEDETDSQDVVDLDRTIEEPDETADSTGNTEGFLSGHDLYKCTACSGTFPSSTVFKSHLNKCQAIATSKEPRPYNCPHCVKTFKNGSTLTEHIRIHGVGKFKCSLCDYEHPYLYQVRYHMKSRHKIASTIVTPLVHNKTDIDKDDFVVRPKVFKRKSIDGGSTTLKESPDETKSDLGKISKLSYGPGEIDQLPRQPIYHCQVTCSVCGYATKVRTNLVRHLEFHLKEKDVPSTAPVNPVPCLEKNEKMFDKMTNLAISSMGSRMGGKTVEGDKVALTKEEEALLPAFVPSTKRFVCGITSCNYLCHEESRLRHHLLALHMDETTYTCTHCKEVLKWEKGNVNIDHVMKHMRLHDLNLYKCAYCNFHHNLKHKVERHVGDKHLDRKLQVVVVREMSSDSDSVGVGTEKDLTTLAKEAKAWKCGMCKYRSATQDDMKTHCVHKHDIDSQYKCALCTYKSNTKETFTGHFEDEHKGNGVDIIDVFYNTNEISTKNDTEVDLFDTTPLWQRDRPRVRHIRGILLDDGRKTKKSLTKITNETETSGEEPKSKPPKTPIKTPTKDTPPDLLSELNSAIREITQTIVVDDDDGPPPPPPPPPKKKRKVSLKKEPKVKIEHPEGVPPEKTPLGTMGTYGPYGAPLNNMFLCPLCNKFNTRFESDITNHLYQELEYFRYKCGLCDTNGITFNFLCEHAKSKHSETNPKDIVGLPKNEQIENWVREVLEVQKQQIDEGARGSADLKKESQTFVEYETVVLRVDDEDDEEVIVDEVPTATTSTETTLVDPKKLQSCPHCSYQCKTPSDLRKHEKRHWAKKPFKCGHCTVEGVSATEILQHSKRVHRDQTPEVIAQEVPENPLIIPLVRKRKLKETTTVEPPTKPPPPKKVAVEKEPPREKPFKCKYCPKRAETVGDLKKHWESTHSNYSFEYQVRETVVVDKDKDKDQELPVKCIFCSFYGRVDELKQHYDTLHADSKHHLHYKCSDCDEYFFRIDMLKGHFYEKHPDKTFLVANCRNRLRKYGKKQPPVTEVDQVQPPVEELKKYKCGNPKCVHTSNSYKAIMAHLRSHAKPYKCSYCQFCCNYPSFMLKHQQFSHAGMELKYETLDESLKANQTLRKQLLVLNDQGSYELLGPEKRKRATGTPKTGDVVDDLLVVHKVVYTARKKTTPTSRPNSKGTARKSTTFVPAHEEGFSYYGQKPEELDLKKLTTKISIGGNDIVTTIEQFSHISNLFPRLLVEDCYKKTPEET